MTEQDNQDRTVVLGDLRITVEGATSWTIRPIGTNLAFAAFVLNPGQTPAIFELWASVGKWVEKVGTHANMGDLLSDVQIRADRYKADLREVLDIDGQIAQICG